MVGETQRERARLKRETGKVERGGGGSKGERGYRGRDGYEVRRKEGERGLGKL